MGYHRATIAKGTLGFFSKIQEEFLELEDAVTQHNPIMALCECADLVGAIEAYAEAHGSKLSDVLTMMEATKRAFKDGSRR